MTIEYDVFIKAKGKLLKMAIALKPFWLRFRRNRGSIFGLILVVILCLIAVSADIISPYDPMEMNLTPEEVLREPTMAHFMGTDGFGRDICSRLIWGTRISLLVGFVAAGTAATIGILVGSFAGYYGGKTDELIMRVVDGFLTIPTFFLIVIIVALFGSSIWNMTAVIGLTMWPSTARLIRAETLSVKNSEFITAARSVGATDAHILFREILPNAIYPAIVNTSIQIASAILYEASLTFLGLGEPNVPSWGWMINGALRHFLTAWWEWAFPGFAISLTVISFNLIGDGLNDALNPGSKRR